MKNTNCCEGSASLGLLIARLTLGISLAFTGGKKLSAPGGVNQFARDHLVQAPHWLGEHYGNLYLHAVPIAEVALGVLLILGLLSRVSGFLASAMLLSFAYAVTHFVTLDQPLPFPTPVTYAALALVILLIGPGKFSMDAMFRRGGAKPAKG